MHGVSLRPHCSPHDGALDRIEVVGEDGLRRQPERDERKRRDAIESSTASGSRAPQRERRVLEATDRIDHTQVASCIHSRFDQRFRQ